MEGEKRYLLFSSESSGWLSVPERNVTRLALLIVTQTKGTLSMSTWSTEQVWAQYLGLPWGTRVVFQRVKLLESQVQRVL